MSDDTDESVGKAADDLLMDLIHATEAGDVSTVADLLKINPMLASTINESPSENPFYQPGATALHYASWMGQKETAAILLAHGADINLRDDSYNDTPLGWANESRQPEMIDFLISNGAALSIGDAARTGKTGLVEAFIVLDPLLVDLGRSSGWTPLFSSAGWGHMDVAKTLLAHGADVNAVSLHGNTALHSAASAGNAEIATLLLDHGAHVDVGTDDGTTALHRAAWQRNSKMVSLLLERSANREIADSHGNHPLELALAQEGTKVDGWGEAPAVDAEVIRMLST
jgi:uncharacterized protein